MTWLIKARHLKLSLGLNNDGHNLLLCKETQLFKNCIRFLNQFVKDLTSRDINLSPPWRILFFGTDEFAMEHLKKIHGSYVDGDYKLIKSLEVVTPKVDKCPVGEFARDNNLECFNWPIPTMTNKYDVGVVVSFGHLIPRRVIDMFPYGILNVHPSILPRWRGASPIIHTILNGDTETGISIIEIRPIQFDVGPLLMQSRFLVPENCTTLQLRDYLAVEGSYMLLNALKELPKLEKMECEQRDEGVTHAHKLTAMNSRVNWKEETLHEIDRQYRALSETYGLRSSWNGHKVKLLDMVPLVQMQAQEIQDQLEKVSSEDEMAFIPGLPHYLDSHNLLCIRCKDTWAGFKGIALKKPLSAKSFFNGYLSKQEFQNIPFESQENELDKFMFESSSFSHSVIRARKFNIL